MHPRPRRPDLLVWAFVLLALALRLIYLAQVVHTPAFRVPTADAALYDLQAQLIAHGDVLAGRKAFFLGPLYSYYLGLVYALAGHRLWVPIALQCVAAALTVLLVAATGRRLFGQRRAGLLAAGLLAVLAQAVYFSSLLLMETLLAFLNAWALWLAVRDEGPARPRNLLLVGLALGVAALGRPSELALLLPIGGFAAWRRATHAATHAAAPAGTPAAGHTASHAPWHAVAGRFAWVLLGAALAIAPVTVRNWIVERDFVPITFSGGFNFYVGNGPQASGATFMLDDLESTDAGVRSYAQREAGRVLKPTQVSQWWGDRARAEVTAHPGRFVRLVLTKVWFFWNALDIPQIEWFTAEREHSGLLRALPGFALLAPLALLGLGLTLRRWRAVGVVHATIGVYVATIALFFVTSRYRVAALPLLCLPAGAALDWVWEAVRQRRVRALALAAAAIAALAVALGSGHFPVDENYTRSQQHVRTAYRLRETGDDASARRELAAAIRTYRDDWQSHYALGVLEQETGHLEPSLQALLKAQRLVPRRPEVPYSLAVTYFKLGAQDQAKQAIDAALALDPYAARNHDYAGVIAAAGGQREEAQRRFRRALELEPDRASAYTNLGTLLGSTGHHAEAFTLFQTAVQKDPDYLPARRNLVLSWLAQGRTLRASQELEQLVARAPRDTFALRIAAMLRQARQ